MKTEKKIVNPFSESFIGIWELWKNFRKEEHNFSYKGVISEQMALKRLVEISEGNENKAIRIVEQSISRGWMDFYQLKQPKPNGSESKQTSTKKQQPTGADSIEVRVANEFNKRYGNGEQATDGSHLKAV